jgi:hypothetical protein
MMNPSGSSLEQRIGRHQGLPSCQITVPDWCVKAAKRCSISSTTDLNGLLNSWGKQWLVDRAGLADANAKNKFSDAQRIAVIQLVVHKSFIEGRFVGRLTGSTAPDQLAVDKGAIAAAQVADAQVGRFDFEHAVMARNAAQIVVQTKVAIVRPANDKAATSLQVDFLAMHAACHGG